MGHPVCHVVFNLCLLPSVPGIVDFSAFPLFGQGVKQYPLSSENHFDHPDTKREDYLKLVIFKKIYFALFPFHIIQGCHEMGLENTCSPRQQTK
jgi:hypothetical protein